MGYALDNKSPMIITQETIHDSMHIIPITPMGAVRMTAKSKWVSKSAKRYLDYKRFIEMYALSKKITLGNTFRADFYLPIPKSRIKKLKHGDYHQQKPDLDNMIKGLLDALKKDDSDVSTIVCNKYWTDKDAGYIVIYQDVNEIKEYQWLNS